MQVAWIKIHGENVNLLVKIVNSSFIESMLREELPTMGLFALTYLDLSTSINT